MLKNQTNLQMTDENNKELAPCIVTKAKVALELPNKYRRNSKRCSLAYWDRTVRAVSAQSGVRFTERQIQNAIQQYGRI